MFMPNYIKKNDISQDQSDMNIRNLIISVRGVQVLLDNDVAMLFGYETKAINLAAKRNEERFPVEFRFQLTNKETEEILKFHFETSSYNSTLPQNAHGGRRTLPYVYSEHGIIMLAGILRNETAVQMSINITKAFVNMRSFLSANRDVFSKMVSIENKLLEHDKKFDEVFDLLQQPETIKQNIFFKGQFYDAFKLVIELIVKATTNIVIIDNYADNSVLDMLKHKKSGVPVTIITANPKRISSHYLNKFTKQYGSIKIIINSDFHDRFIIIDDQKVYAFGASLKDLGNKCFEVSKIEDTIRFISFLKGIVYSHMLNEVDN
jgi:hypothetical protein